MRFASIIMYQYINILHQCMYFLERVSIENLTTCINLIHAGNNSTGAVIYQKASSFVPEYIEWSSRTCRVRKNI